MTTAKTTSEQKGAIDRFFDRFLGRTLSFDISLLLWMISFGVSCFILAAFGNAIIFSAKDLVIYIGEFIIAMTLYPQRADGYRFSYEGFGWEDRRDRIRWLIMLVVSFLLSTVSIFITGASILQIAETTVVAVSETIFFGLWFPQMIIVVLERIPIIKRLKVIKRKKTPIILVGIGILVAQLVFTALHGRKYAGTSLWWVFFFGLFMNGLSFYFPGVGVAIHFTNNLFAAANG